MNKTEFRHDRIQSQLTYMERHDVIHVWSPPYVGRPKYRVQISSGGSMMNLSLGEIEAFVSGAHAWRNAHAGENPCIHDGQGVRLVQTNQIGRLAYAIVTTGSDAENISNRVEFATQAQGSSYELPQALGRVVTLGVKEVRAQPLATLPFYPKPKELAMCSPFILAPYGVAEDTAKTISELPDLFMRETVARHFSTVLFDSYGIPKDWFLDLCGVDDERKS